jgi:transcriptional regulator with XRE-family HTH domain
MPKSAVLSSFAERFEYSRDRQRVLGTWAKDEVLAEAIGVSQASVSDYKAREIAPPVDRTLAIARWCGVDPGWLGFGEDTKAPAPDGFAQWLESRRAPRLAMKPAKSAAPAARKRA